MQRVTGAAAKAAIARLMLGDRVAPDRLGEIALMDHQQEAVRLLRRLLDEHRGALLADDVGLGKTFSALAVAADFETLVIGPAAVRSVWEDAARRGAAGIAFVSVEELSRGRMPAVDPELVIVDEAHTVRTLTTRRFAAVRQLCRSARVLLLTATPVQNREDDLRALLSLFLGEVAHALPAETLARFVVRRAAHQVTSSPLRLPVTAPPRWLPAIDDSDCLARILELPPPVPPSDGASAGALAAYSLARQWASSRAALHGALARRLARGLALLDALHAGRHPTRAELAAWVFADGAQQLAFPELVGAGAPCASDTIAHVEAHLDGLRALRAWLRVTPDPDVIRARQLSDLLAAHPGERIVAFTEFTETASSLFTRLAGNARVAALTHTGGRVAGGPISRREIIERFTPGLSARQAAADVIDLLVTTDVLSEGVGLHDASVVVHLDLAWNPARLEQRAGRLRRLGASRDTISVYLARPLHAAERLLDMEHRLRDKLRVAARTIGLAGEIVPGAVQRDDSAADVHGRIRATLRSWSRPDAPAGVVAGSVRARAAGALACVRRDGRSMLVAWDGCVVDDDPVRVARLLADAGDTDTDCADALTRDAEQAVTEWLARTRVASVIDLGMMRVARSRRSMLQRAEGISRRTPRHAQPAVAPLLRAVRAAATATLSAGAERVLDELAQAPMPDAAWLQAVRQFADLHAPAPAEAARIEAMLLLVPDRSGYSPSAGSNSSRVGSGTP